MEHIMKGDDDMIVTTMAVMIMEIRKKTTIIWCYCCYYEWGDRHSWNNINSDKGKEDGDKNVRGNIGDDYVDFVVVFD